MFYFGMVPEINKPTNFTRENASAIDIMFISSIINTEAKAGRYFRLFSNSFCF